MENIWGTMGISLRPASQCLYVVQTGGVLEGIGANSELFFFFGKEDLGLVGSIYPLDRWYLPFESMAETLKASPFEPSIHVPLMISGFSVAKRLEEHPVSLIDDAFLH